MPVQISRQNEVIHPFSDGGFDACYQVVPSTTRREILRTRDRRASPAYQIIEAAPAFGVVAPAIEDFDPGALNLLFKSADVTLVWVGGGAKNAEEIVEAFISHLRPGGIAVVVVARDHALDSWLQFARSKSAKPIFRVERCALMRPGHLAVTRFQGGQRS